MRKWEGKKQYSSIIYELYELCEGFSYIMFKTVFTVKSDFVYLFITCSHTQLVNRPIDTLVEYCKNKWINIIVLFCNDTFFLSSMECCKSTVCLTGSDQIADRFYCLMCLTCNLVSIDIL